MSALQWIGLTALIAFVAGGIACFVSQRAAREKRDAEALRDSVENQRNLPQTLHPVIDGELCIGSLSCLTVCPEGDILGVVDGRAELINASAACAGGRCTTPRPKRWRSSAARPTAPTDGRRAMVPLRTDACPR